MPENRIEKKEKTLLETRAALKKALKELKACEADTHRLIEKSVHGALVVDGEGIIQHANKTAAALFDTSVTALIGQKCSIPFAKNRAIESSLMFHNRPLMLEIWAFTVRWDQRPTTLIYIVDITERKKVEEKLQRLAAAQQQQLNFLQRLIDTIPAPIFYKDADGKYLGCNASFETFVSLSRGEVIGRTVYDLAPPDLAEIYHKMDQDLFDSPGIQVYETSVVDSQGKHKEVIFNKATFTDSSGNVAGLVGVIIDITDRKELERMKDEMISTVSHEMRTPLTAMLGYIEFMLEHDVSPDKQREYLVTVHSATQRLNELIDNFLTMQRLRAKLGKYDFKPLNLCSLLNEVAALYEHASSRHKVTVMCPPDVPQVFGDGESLNRVINNLVSNAIKYSPKGGEIVIGAERKDDTVTIWTKDEGIGIAPEFQDKIFDRFYRVDSTSRRVTGGTGLGLALAREIVEAHGGSIRVESTPGKGSTFYISLLLIQNASVQQ